MSRPRPETRCARPPRPESSTTTPLSPPILLSSVYQVAGLDHIDAIYERRDAGYVYARDGNPNAAQLAAKLAGLEGAEAGLVCASGMAAESALLLTLLESGDHVALSEGLYGRTVALVGRELARFGVGHDLFDPTEPKSLEAALQPRTRAVLVETLSNPLVRLADVPALARIARRHGATLIVDNTFAPLLCRPLDHGADAIVHSLTKLISGHGDVTLGLAAGTRAMIERAAQVASTFGLTGNPFESWLCLRGVTTLAVRSQRACATALELAGRLARHPAVGAVHYPGLETHPDHARAKELLAGGFGTVLTIDLGARPDADRFINRLSHVPFAPSLGDVSTTLSHPATTSHRGQSPEQWRRQGITPGLVRLSIGLEDVSDLWDDLEHALA